MYENTLRNKKKYVLIIAAAVMLILSTALTAKAAPESTVEIEFTEGNAAIPPVNPDNPEIPGNGESEESGSLALNYVSYFDFGSQEISAVEEKYPVLTEKPYIQATDLRGLASGWEINARLSKFESGGIESLAGSTLDFTDASLETTTKGIDEPTASSSFTLKADGETTVKVVEAAPNAGMGTWLVKWYKTPSSTPNYSVQLTVPSGSGIIEQNIAKITWLLTDGPTT